MKIEQVKAIAQLVRLHFSQQELAAMNDTLDEVFSLMDEIEKIDTEGLPALTHPLNMAQRMREDEVTEAENNEALHAIAPVVDEHLYLVPKVIS